MAKQSAAFHHKALNAAMKAGDHATAKRHALNLGNALHKGMAVPEPEPDQADPMEASEPAEPPEKRGLGNWIGGMHLKKGALHRQLGIPQGQKIPAKKIASAENSDNPLLAKRARLAATFASFRK